jgi:hypothetical protein
MKGDSVINVVDEEPRITNTFLEIRESYLSNTKAVWYEDRIDILINGLINGHLVDGSGNWLSR